MSSTKRKRSQTKFSDHRILSFDAKTAKELARILEEKLEVTEEKRGNQFRFRIAKRSRG